MANTDGVSRVTRGVGDGREINICSNGNMWGMGAGGYTGIYKIKKSMHASA